MKKRIVFLFISVMLILGIVSESAVVSFAEDAMYFNNILDVVVQSSDGNSNFRTGPGMAYNVIQPIPNGIQLRIAAVSKNSSDGLVWGQTTYNNRTGWVSLRNTYVTDVETASVAVYDVTVSQQENICLRKGPGAEYGELYRPANGQVLRIDRTMANSFDGRPWGRTTINGMQGWVSLNWTTRNNSWTYNQSKDAVFRNNSYGAVVSSSDGSLNLRTGPGLGYDIITPIYNGNVMYVTAVLDNSSDGLVWGQTSYNGYTGWISMRLTAITGIDNASIAQYSVTVQNSKNAILRRGPGSEYDALVSNIPRGTSLFITQTVINSFDGRPWGKTRLNGIDGWISLNWTIR